MSSSEEHVARLIVIEALIKDHQRQCKHGAMFKSFYDALDDIQKVLCSPEVAS